jgi:hypothetical protein
MEPCLAADTPRLQPPRIARRAPLRLALISTPRSGNNWLRRLLAKLYRAPEVAAHTPAEVDWPRLPRQCILGIHWRPTAAFRSMLREAGFRPVVLARHPFDVLVSVLHFTAYDPSPAQWLDGESGDERAIRGAMPCSAAFAAYAASARAQALLSVSQQWWDVPGCLRVRYEDLVSDPHGELARLADRLGAAPRYPAGEALAETTLAKLRAQTKREHHFWQGRPGLWRRLLPPAQAHRIARAHREVFATLGYRCDPDPMLDRARADAHWVELTGAELARKAEASRQLAAVREERDALRRQADSLQTELALARARLAEAAELGPLAIRLAWAVRRWSVRYPRTATFLKRLAGAAG